MTRKSEPGVSGCGENSAMALTFFRAAIYPVYQRSLENLGSGQRQDALRGVATLPYHS